MPARYSAYPQNVAAFYSRTDQIFNKTVLWIIEKKKNLFSIWLFFLQCFLLLVEFCFQKILLFTYMHKATLLYLPTISKKCILNQVSSASLGSILSTPLQPANSKQTHHQNTFHSQSLNLMIQNFSDHPSIVLSLHHSHPFPSPANSIPFQSQSQFYNANLNKSSIYNGEESFQPTSSVEPIKRSNLRSDDAHPVSHEACRKYVCLILYFMESVWYWVTKTIKLLSISSHK